MIDEKGLFDWTIIEEAAKASGTDLVQPLLLSYRRLMIGDHLQLPPFDLEKFEALLADPPAVQKAISATQRLVARHLRDAAIDEAIEESETSQDDFSKTCADALRFLTMFATFIRREYDRIDRKPNVRRIARRLNEQHRMHPAIATLVSSSFYKGDLLTFEEKKDEFLTTPVPIILDSNLGIPQSPIVFVDMPYSRMSRPGTDFGDSEQPFRVNRSEARICGQVLRSLQVRSGLKKKPTLAILSPYMEQAKLLRAGLHWQVKTQLNQAFRPEDDEDFFGTVDSFQGREADCVLISLVRNNEHTNPVKALGFLAKSNRMNVLISRAKHKLIVVGSYSFLRHVVDDSKSKSDRSLDFLRLLLEALRKGAERPISKAIDTKEVSFISHEKFS